VIFSPGSSPALLPSLARRAASVYPARRIRPPQGGGAHATMLLRCIATLFVLAVAAPAAAVTVVSPARTAEIFSRADFVDLIELLRLAGADVEFAAAAGSYTARAGGREVQFTPGGSLAVVDGRLQPLPGPIRFLEGHAVGTAAVAAALLAPLGWELTGSVASGFTLAPTGDAAVVAVSVVVEEGATVVVTTGPAALPRPRPAPGGLALVYQGPIRLAVPVAPQGGLQGVAVEGNTLTLTVAPGWEVAASYPLDEPLRFVVRLASSMPTGTAALPRRGPLVVIDPGHGGEDQGAAGAGGVLEKTVTLAVARLVAERLRTVGVEARLTRDGDETVPLRERTALANRLRADAFISIHANASPARGARGAETYYMSADASDPQAAATAERENAPAEHSTLGLILWDLAHVANLNASARLAREIQDRLNVVHGIASRGVKQAPFVVLTGATMPAALVEIGFLSHPEEGQLVSQPDTQARIADALAAAVVAFLRAAPAAETLSQP